MTDEDKEKTRAEIDKLNAETALLRAQNEKRLQIELEKLIAETAKIQAESRWYPFVATAGLFAAAVGFIKLIQIL